MDYVRVVNNYVTEQEPWKVAKDESRAADLDRILYATAEALRVVAVLLHPVMPKASAILWQSLGAEAALGPLAEASGCRTPAAGASCRPGRRSPRASRCSRASRSPSRREPRRARPGRAGGRVAGPRDATARRRSRCGCRWPTATATSTSPTRRTTGCRVEDALAASTAVGVPADRADRLRPARARGGRSRRRGAHDAAGGRRRAAPQRGAAARRAPATLDAALAEIDALAADPVVRAVGETGLDYFRTGADGRADQEASFRAHIEMAKRHGKALVIHDRDAHDDVLRVLEDAGAPDRVVFHCFSGDVGDGRALRRHAAAGCRSPAP